MKVYGVIEKWVCNDGFDSGTNINLFDTKEKAIKYFKGLVNVAQTENNYDTIEKEEYSFSGYNNGYYSYDHIDITINEIQVK